MENSLTNYELTESTIKNATDSENGSDKSDPIEIVNHGDDVPVIQPNEDFDNHLPPTVTLLRDPKTDAKVYLVGTAHFSRHSQDDVRKVIQNVQPDIVILELCHSRLNLLSMDEEKLVEEVKNIDLNKIIQTIRTNGAFNGFMYLLLLNMNVHLTKEMGMAPGGEFRVAYQEAIAIRHCAVHLGDRPIRITLKRALAKLTWFQFIKLTYHLITSKEAVTIEDIEKCKNKDMLEQLIAELAGEYPGFREVFLDERDIFLTHSIQACASSKIKPESELDPKIPKGPARIVAVVGLGHVPGITKLWPISQRPFLKNIMTLPPPTLTSKIIRFTFKASVVAAGGYLVYKYVPVPKFVRSNAQILTDKLLSSVNSYSGFSFSLK